MPDTITPTGQRLWDESDDPSLGVDQHTRDDIVAIEQEAAAAERGRLRTKAGTSRTAANITVFLEWLFEAPSDD